MIYNESQVVPSKNNENNIEIEKEDIIDTQNLAMNLNTMSRCTFYLTITVACISIISYVAIFSIFKLESIEQIKPIIDTDCVGICNFDDEGYSIFKLTGMRKVHRFLSSQMQIQWKPTGSNINQSFNMKLYQELNGHNEKIGDTEAVANRKGLSLSGQNNNNVLIEQKLQNINVQCNLYNKDHQCEMKDQLPLIHKEMIFDQQDIIFQIANYDTYDEVIFTNQIFQQNSTQSWILIIQHQGFWLINTIFLIQQYNKYDKFHKTSETNSNLVQEQKLLIQQIALINVQNNILTEMSIFQPFSFWSLLDQFCYFQGNIATIIQMTINLNTIILCIKDKGYDSKLAHWNYLCQYFIGIWIILIYFFLQTINWYQTNGLFSIDPTKVIVWASLGYKLLVIISIIVWFIHFQIMSFKIWSNRSKIPEVNWALFLINSCLAICIVFGLVLNLSGDVKTSILSNEIDFVIINVYACLVSFLASPRVNLKDLKDSDKDAFITNEINLIEDDEN